MCVSVCVCVCVRVCVSCLSLCIITPRLACGLPVDEQSKGKKKKEKMTVKHNVRDMLDELLTSSTHPHPFHTHNHTNAHSCSLSQLSLPHLSVTTLYPPPPLRSLHSASFLSVTAFDLSTSIKANLTRQRKVTCTQGGQGEVVFVPRGAASVPGGLEAMWQGRGGGVEGGPTWPEGVGDVQLAYTAVCVQWLSAYKFDTDRMLNVDLQDHSGVWKHFLFSLRQK